MVNGHARARFCPPATLKSSARCCPCHYFLKWAIAHIARATNVLARAARGQKRAFCCIVNRWICFKKAIFSIKIGQFSLIIVKKSSNHTLLFGSE